MKNELSVFHVSELSLNELIEIEGGSKKFGETFVGKLLMALLVGFAAAVGKELAEEIFN